LRQRWGSVELGRAWGRVALELDSDVTSCDRVFRSRLSSDFQANICGALAFSALRFWLRVSRGFLFDPLPDLSIYFHFPSSQPLRSGRGFTACFIGIQSHVS